MIIYIFMFVLGTIFGSFYLVIGTRLPKKEDVITSRSKCDNCNHVLKWYNLIPLLSYILQRGKCCYCHKKISSEHFWVELITGILFVLCSIYFPIGYKFYIGLIIVSLMIIIFITDFKYMIILDSPLIISGILIIVLKFTYYNYKAVLLSIGSGIVMFLIMLLIEKLGTLILHKESLGGGDIKFGFIMGLCLNIRLALAALVLSTFVALPYAIASLYLNKHHEFPYGPFLIGAVFIVFFHANKFMMLINYLIPFA